MKFYDGQKFADTLKKVITFDNDLSNQHVIIYPLSEDELFFVTKGKNHNFELTEKYPDHGLIEQIVVRADDVKAFLTRTFKKSDPVIEVEKITDPLNRWCFKNGKRSFLMDVGNERDVSYLVRSPDVVHSMLEISAGRLKEIIDSHVPGITKDVTRYYLNGIMFYQDTQHETLHTVSSDGHILIHRHHNDIPFPEAEQNENKKFSGFFMFNGNNDMKAANRLKGLSSLLKAVDVDEKVTILYQDTNDDDYSREPAVMEIFCDSFSLTIRDRFAPGTESYPSTIKILVNNFEQSYNDNPHVIMTIKEYIAAHAYVKAGKSLVDLVIDNDTCVITCEQYQYDVKKIGEYQPGDDDHHVIKITHKLPVINNFIDFLKTMSSEKFINFSMAYKIPGASRVGNYEIILVPS